jgi:hypothetical protein
VHGPAESLVLHNDSIPIGETRGDFAEQVAESGLEAHCGAVFKVEATTGDLQAVIARVDEAVEGDARLEVGQGTAADHANDGARLIGQASDRLEDAGGHAGIPRTVDVGSESSIEIKQDEKAGSVCDAPGDGIEADD